MRLGLRTGQACAKLLDESMRQLPCRQIQIDEIWGFIGKKRYHLQPGDPAEYGDVWTYAAIDPESKIVPSYTVGARDLQTTHRFISDLHSRVSNRVQISSDGLHDYLKMIDEIFGENVDYGRVVKTYTEAAYMIAGERRYSCFPHIHIKKSAVRGNPDPESICISHIERKNLTFRMHMRRLTRLTNAHSKKLENHSAAVALHLAYYNFVRIHSSIRATPAMAIGIASSIWQVQDLVALC